MTGDGSGDQVVAAVAVGANLTDAAGSRAEHYAAGVAALREAAGVRVLSESSVYETPPLGTPGQGPYLNGVVILKTALSPTALLALLHEVERSRGRVRSDAERWGPRTLDLDLLLYGDRVIDEPGLRVPHPRLAERAFVLVPLVEVASDWIVPRRNASVHDLLAQLDPSDVSACRPTPRGDKVLK